MPKVGAATAALVPWAGWAPACAALLLRCVGWRCRGADRALAVCHWFSVTALAVRPSNTSGTPLRTTREPNEGDKPRGQLL